MRDNHSGILINSEKSRRREEGRGNECTYVLEKWNEIISITESSKRIVVIEVYSLRVSKKKKRNYGAKAQGLFGFGGNDGNS